MPPTENDFLGSSAIDELTRAPITDIYQGLKGYFHLAQARYIEDSSDYCSYMYRKSTQVRALYSRTKPLNLDDVYVQTHFSNWRRERRDDREIERDFATGKRIIVKGNGGSGKTFFVRWLWLRRFRSSSGRIPILVELRRISDLATIDIVSFCRSELQAELIFGKGIFERLCQDGKFEFIFDGFDEVSRANRKAVERQIIDLSDKYSKCSFLVTGREDDRFSGWGAFEVFDVSPLNLLEVRALIEKVPFDAKVQKRFLENLNEKFYEEYKSFL